jgi:hypothetical protein
VRRLLPGESGDAFFQLYDHRETFFRWLEQLPQTVCHFDAFRRNLIARQDGEGNEETVVIDWAFAGLGPVGAEIVALVWVSLVSRKEALASSVAGELDRIAFQGYMEGLGKTGWRGDPRQVRLAYTAAVALRRIGTLGYVAMFLLADQLAEPEATEPPDAEQLAFLDNLARIGPFVEDLAREAGQLAESLL